MSEVHFPSGFVFHFPAFIDAWHDGDSCTVHRQDRPGVVIHGEHVRIDGINAPELHAVGGPESLAYAQGIAPVGTLVTLTCSRVEKYGRLLCRVTLPDGYDFGSLMLAAGEAVAYNP